MNHLENTLATSLNFLKADLQKELREYSMKIIFTKKDVTKRVMQCTLRPDVLTEQVTPYEKKTERVKKENPDVLSVWDLEAKGWRSININTIISAEYL